MRVPPLPALWCLVIALLWLAVNAAWLSLDQRPPFWDAAHHATLTLQVAQAWSGVGGESLKAVLASTIYPPLVYVACAPAAWMAPHVDALTLWMNMSFGVLLVMSVGGMARVLGLPWVGVGAILLALYQPMTIVTARAFLLDVPLTAMVTWAYWRILACERRWTLRNGSLLGLALGLGMLTKWSCALYLIPALGWLAYRRLRSGGALTDWRVVITVTGVAFAICGWWYLWRWPELIAHLARNTWQARVLEQDPLGWTGRYLIYYVWAYQSLIPCVAWLCAAGLLLWRGPRMGRILVLWGLTSDVLLGLAPNKDMRFFLPLVALRAFVTWWGVTQIRHASWRRTAMVTLGIFCVIQLSVLSSHHAARWLGPLQFPQQLSSLSLSGRMGFAVGPAAPPMADESVVAAAVDRLAALPSSRPLRILMLASDRYHNAATLRYEAFRRHVQLDVVTLVDPALTDHDLWVLWQQPYDIILYREPVITHFPHVQRNIEVLARALRAATDRYRLIEQLPIPTGGILEIYAQTG